MKLFSQRKGISQAEKAFQLERMDDDLRNRLWTALELGLWRRWSPPSGLAGVFGVAAEVEDTASHIWTDFFKLPLDTMPPFDPRLGNGGYKRIRTWFFDGQWWQRYDLVEFVAVTCPDKWRDSLCAEVNRVLESENAAYRAVAGKVVQITAQEEVAAIEDALESARDEVRAHLERSLELLADRKSPDYRNSVKESISAVEAMCRWVTGSPKATLGDCIRLLKRDGSVHPALEQALDKLYGYTCDETGVRHALTDNGQPPSYPEAKFMLVACSAFVSLILAKGAR
jgi:hypothetical protein